jgi:hypothetical protein
MVGDLIDGRSFLSGLQRPDGFRDCGWIGHQFTTSQATPVSAGTGWVR